MNQHKTNNLKRQFILVILPVAVFFSVGATNNFASNNSEEINNIEHKITDLKDGVYEFDSENAGVKYEIPVKNGLIHGNMKEYSSEDNALLSQIDYVKGIKEGTAVTYYPDGTLKSEMIFHNNQQDGNVKTYYANGQLRYIMPYLKGVPHGNASMYDDLGNLVRTAVFKQGEVIEDTPAGS